MTQEVVKKLDIILNNFRALFDKESGSRYASYIASIKRYNHRIYAILKEIHKFNPTDIEYSVGGNGFVVGMYIVKEDGVGYYSKKGIVTRPKDIEHFYLTIIEYFEKHGDAITRELKRVIDFVTAFKTIAKEEYEAGKRKSRWRS
jgi:hypothetical protein